MLLSTMQGLIVTLLLNHHMVQYIYIIMSWTLFSFIDRPISASTLGIPSAAGAYAYVMYV